MLVSTIVKVRHGKKNKKSIDINATISKGTQSATVLPPMVRLKTAFSYLPKLAIPQY